MAVAQRRFQAAAVRRGLGLALCRHHADHLSAGFEARRRQENAPVAQLDRAPDYESGGRGFESFPVRQSVRLASARIQLRC